MTDAPDVSVIMSAFNSEAYIETAIRSIVSQTLTSWEFLIYDDGSKDRTSEVIAGFADPRIKHFRDGRNFGLAHRLNMGIGAARGRYIARMDADDISYPDRLRRQVLHLNKNHEVDLIGADAVVFADSGVAIGKFDVPRDHEGITRAPLRGFLLPHPTWMGRADWFRRYGYRESARRAQDQDLLLRTFRQSRFANLALPLLGYRQDNLTAKNILRGRAQYVKSLWSTPEVGRLSAARGTVEHVLRGAATISLVKLGRHDLVLAKRLAPLSAPEKAEWSSIWNETN